MKEFFCEDSKIVSQEKQTQVFLKYVENSDKLVKSDNALRQMLDFYNSDNNKDKLQIYWPFAENWDGETMPVISFMPEDKFQKTNKAYYIEDGNLKCIDVDIIYAMTNPVWIINESLLGYDNIPNYNDLCYDKCMNIIPRKRELGLNMFKMTTRSSDYVLMLNKIRALRISGNSFFCESNTYTFHFHLPDPNDRSSTTYQQVVVNMTQAELLAGEYRLLEEPLFDLALNTNYHVDLRLTITKYVEPRNVSVQIPLRVNNSGNIMTIMSELSEPEDAYLFYRGTLSLLPIYDDMYGDHVYICEELEWILNMALYTGV